MLVRGSMTPGFRFFSDAYFSTHKDSRQTIGCTYILYEQGAHMPDTILTYSEERRRKRRRSTYSTCAASERCKRRKFLPRLRRGCGISFVSVFNIKNAARRRFFSVQVD